MSGVSASVDPAGTGSRPARRAWPVLAALICMLSGLLMLAGTAYLRGQRPATIEQAKQLRTQLAQASSRVERSAVLDPEATLNVPHFYAHLSDVETLIRVSQQQTVRLSALQFRSDRVENLPYIIRIAEFRIEEDYPRLKTFVAELLNRMPHLYLDELRVDQGGEVSGKVQATLRLSFVYQAGADQPAGALPMRSSP